MAIDFCYLLPRHIYTNRIELRKAEGVTVLNEILTAVDLHYQHGGKPLAAIKNANGKVLAWVEAVAGPAPNGTPAIALVRGEMIHSSRDNWDGDRGVRPLKAGRKTLLEQHGD